jgi:hypothetical protein
MIRTMSKMTVATILASAALAGCKKEEPMPTIPAKVDAATAPVLPKATTAAATQPATSLPTTTTGAVNSAAGAVDSGKTAAAKEAQTKLGEVAQLIKDNKFDLADGALKKLEENKASLPESVQSRLPEFRKTLDAAKNLGSGTKLLAPPKAPEVPGLNK